MKVVFPSPRTTRLAPAHAYVTVPARRLALLLLALLLLPAAPAALRAQQQQTPTTPEQKPAPDAPAPAPVGEVIDEDDVLRIDSNLVTIPALVTETTGRPVPNLKVEDFELRVDGQLKQIGEMSRADTPVVLAVLFDNSSSLSTAREFEKQAAVTFFRRIVRPIDSAAVYSVSTVPVLARPLTNDVSALVRTVEQFAEPEGATALFDAVSQAADYLRTRDARRVIVVVSDGNDTISESSFDHAIQRALKYDCQIYIVGTGDIENQNFTDTIARRRLQVFAAQTGGALYVPRTVEDLDHAFEQISDDISQQYVLSYHPSDDPPDGRFRQIELRVKTRPTLRVRAREGYYAGAGQAQIASAAQTPSRVRQRTVGAPKTGAARGGANKAQGSALKDQPAQVASLDPLYASPAAGSMRESAAAARDIKIKTAPTSSARSARNGPRENADTSEPERPAPSASTAEAQPVQTTYEPSPSRTPGTSLFGSSASITPSAPLSTATTAADPQPQPPKTRSTTLEVARGDSVNSSAPKPAPPTNPEPAPSKSTPPAPVSGGVLNGKALRLPAPAYPSAARNVRAGGKVTVEVEIDEEGRVTRAQAVSGHSMLQSAAVNAARQARFSPTLLSGAPVRITGQIVYNFIQP
ncbi:MAG TPA: VWA domain-containing protein [Pyrinomonadaceae bacterium]